MENLAETLITLGGLFPIGRVTDLLGRRTPLPRVALLSISLIDFTVLYPYGS